MTLRVLGVAGSLRKASYNRALLRAVGEALPPTATMEIFDGLAALPTFDPDSKAEPPPVVAWKQALAQADAVVIATPEYNYSIPGVLKNAIDWASRPAAETPFAGKPVAIMGASPGAVGTAKAQLDLRLVLASNGALVLPGPEVLVARCQEKFDASGRLADEATRKFVARLLEALAAAARRAG